MPTEKMDSSKILGTFTFKPMDDVAWYVSPQSSPFSKKTREDRDVFPALRNLDEMDPFLSTPSRRFQSVWKSSKIVIVFFFLFSLSTCLTSVLSLLKKTSEDRDVFPAL